MKGIRISLHALPPGHWVDLCPGSVRASYLGKSCPPGMCWNKRFSKSGQRLSMESLALFLILIQIFLDITTDP